MLQPYLQNPPKAYWGDYKPFLKILLMGFPSQFPAQGICTFTATAQRAEQTQTMVGESNNRLGWRMQLHLWKTDQFWVALDWLKPTKSSQNPRDLDTDSS